MKFNTITTFIFSSIFYQSISAKLDCKDFEVNSYKFNLEKFNKVFESQKTNYTFPPTTDEVYIRLNPCAPLAKMDNVDAEDQCSDKAYGCKITTNYKKDQPPRVTRVQELAKSTTDQSEPNWSVTDADNKVKALTWSMGNQDKDKLFQVKIIFNCDANSEVSEPIFTTNTDSELQVLWNTKYVCMTKEAPTKPDPTPPKDPEQPSKPEQPDNKSSSGFSTFLIILFVFLGIYFIGGCVYNYHFYDARGLNLIPHVNFWREVPEMTMQLIRRGVVLISGRRRGAYSRV